MLNCLGSDDLQAWFLHPCFLPHVMNGSRKRPWGRKLHKQQGSVGQQCPVEAVPGFASVLQNYSCFKERSVSGEQKTGRI